MVKAKLVRQLSYLWVLDTNDLKTSVANQPGYFKECVFTLSWLKNDAGLARVEF